MKKVIVYTKNTCPFCIRAKNLLTDKEIPFEEVNLEGNPEELMKLKEKTGWMTVPQIFIGEEMIGGFSELSQLEEKGTLDELVK